MVLCLKRNTYFGPKSPRERKGPRAFKPSWTLGWVGKGGDEQAQPTATALHSSPHAQPEHLGPEQQPGTCWKTPEPHQVWANSQMLSWCHLPSAGPERFGLFFALGLHRPLEMAIGQPKLSYHTVGLQLLIQGSRFLEVAMVQQNNQGKPLH